MREPYLKSIPGKIRHAVARRPSGGQAVEGSQIIDRRSGTDSAKLWQSGKQPGRIF